MHGKGTTIDFNGQNVYAGIDIHLKSWKVTIMLGDREHKTFSQDPNAETLRNYLRKLCSKLHDFLLILLESGVRPFD